LLPFLDTLVDSQQQRCFRVANMADPELEAIRRARMAELQASRGGGGGAGGGSSSGLSSGGMGGGMGGGEDGAKQQQEQEAQDEMKRQALSTILDPDARERRE
jgi:programmed cell death protein 5